MGKRIWSFINSNIVILIIGSIIVGRGIIIPVLGTEPSIPVTLVVILVIFLVMTASFYLGGVHMVGGMFGWFWKKQKMPLRARILFKAASIMASANPILWVSGWMFRSKRQQQRRSEALLQVVQAGPDKAILPIRARIQEEWNERQHEPPADTSK